MRETSGTTWMFGLIILFIFIFAAFLILSLDYSATFRLKNELTTIVEDYEGYTDKSRIIIDNLLLNEAYNNLGKCPTGSYGATSLNNSGEPAVSGKDYYYCIDRQGNYYDITLFYQFNLPVIGNLLNYAIVGETKRINIYDLKDLLE